MLGLGTAPANPHPRTLWGTGDSVLHWPPGPGGSSQQGNQVGSNWGSARPADRWLDSATWWPSQRLQSQATFLFWFWGFQARDFFPSSQQGSVTIRTPCPLIGFCLDMASYQRAQPRHFKQDRKINKELFPNEVPARRACRSPAARGSHPSSCSPPPACHL